MTFVYGDCESRYNISKLFLYLLLKISRKLEFVIFIHTSDYRDIIISWASVIQDNNISILLLVILL